MEQQIAGRTRKVMSLFVATALMLGTTACSDRDCVDNNRDGYCDSTGGSSSGGYYGGTGSSYGSKSKSSSGITSGSKGGIGSSGSSSS
ncbi:hypothetical protein [Paenibacillus sp. GD4]|uniref:hypothetical protein n=1 Tax=Paenibacillus sp. GD4 TaxID=3068890 RepID=UPI0035900C72